MKVRILSSPQEALREGYTFYERKGEGLGTYFLDSIFSDIDYLLISAGVHELHFGFFRALSARFPFAIYDKADQGEILVGAVLDCRRKLTRVREQFEN